MQDDSDKKRKLSKYLKLLPYLALVVCLFLTIITWRIWDNFNTERERDRYTRNTKRIDGAITERLHDYKMVLTGGAGVFAASQDVSRKEWRAYVEYRQIRTLFPGIQSMGFSVVIKPSALGKHIQAIRSEGFPNYTVHPEGNREAYTSIIFIEPFDLRNRQVLGYDMFSDSVRRAAMERARDTGNASISGKVTLIQETGKDVQAGFLMYLPIYAKGMPIASVEERRAALVGYVHSSFRMNDLLRGVFPVRDNILAYQIYDGAEVSPKGMMYASYATDSSAKEKSQPTFSSQRTIDLYGHQWTFRYHTGKSFDATSDRYTAKVILGTGFAIAMLAFLFFMALINMRKRVLMLAHDMTSVLRKSEDQYRTLNDSLSVGVSIIGPNMEILAANITKKRWFPDNDYEQQPLCYATYNNPPRTEHCEGCPVVKTFQDGQEHTSEREANTLRGKRSLAITAVPITDSDGNVISVHETVDDITERKQTEERLQRLQRESDLILNAVGEGIYGVDLEGRVSFINPEAARLLGYEREELFGQMQHAVIHHTRPDGTPYPREECPIYAAFTENIAQSVNDEIFWRKDGTSFPVSYNSTPLRGDDNQATGAVVVFRDITERKLTDETLRRNEEIFRLFVEHSPASIAMFDLEMRYIVASRRYIQEYGLNEQNLVGRSHYEIFPEIPAHWREVHRRCLAGAIESAEEEKFVRADGSIDWVHWEIRPWNEVNGQIGGIILFSEVITSRKAIEDALKSNQAQLETALASMTDAVFISDAAGRFIHFNHAFATFHRFSSKAECAKTLAEYPDILDVFMDSGELAPLEMWAVPRALRGETVTNAEYTLRRKDTGETWIGSYSFSPIRDKDGLIVGSVVVGRDITEPKKVYDSLRKSQELFRKTLDLGVVGMATTHPDTYYFLSANQRLCEMIGYTEEELLQKTWVEITFPKEKVDEDSANLAKLLSGELNGYVMEKQYQHKDGHMIDITLSVQGVRKNDGTMDYILILIDDITERKSAEADIQRLNERILIATRSARVGIWDWDVINDLLAWDDQMYALYGLIKDEFSGAYEAWVKGLHPDDRAAGEAILKQALQYENNYESEFRVIWPDGSIHFLTSTANIIRDADGKPLRMIGVNYDITDRKLAEQELVQHREHLEELVAERTQELRQMTERMTLAARAGGVGVWDYDPVNNILNWDDQMFALYGITPNQFNGAYEAWQAGLHPEDRQRGDEAVRLALSGEKEFDIEFRVVWPDGSIRYIRALASVQRDAAWLPLHMIGTNWDITATKNLHEQLDLSKKAAEAANQAKSIFVANMSHEIRTPMNAILGFAQVLERDPSLTAEQAEHVRTIHRSGGHLLRLINDILDMSKIEAGRTTLTEAAFCLHDLLDDLLLMFRARAEIQGLQLLMERNESVPRYATADEGKLRQVLVNLLGNAVKFTVTGGVAVRVRAEAVAGKTGEDTGHLRLMVEVEDSGPGIPDEDRESIFDPFQQAGAGVKSGGTGLGLAISRKFVEMMGGELTVTSQVGKGSCFRFDLLLKPAAEIAKMEKRASRRIVGLEPGTGPFRILAVDDAPTNRALLCALLRPLGFEVAEAGNGAEALEVFERWSPHAVLMDMRMPVMDGYEATRRLRASEAGRATPVIAITASAFEDSKDEVMATGVDAYVRKPFRMEEICEALEKYLGLRYVFADEAPNDPSEMEAKPLTNESLTALPKDLIQAMQQAVAEGNMARLAELIAQVEKVDSAAAQGLQALADQYDYEKLNQWLEKGATGNG